MAPRKQLATKAAPKPPPPAICHIETLSNELVTKVLRAVGGLGDDGAATLALAVPAVCKQWREICSASIDVRIGLPAAGITNSDGHTQFLVPSELEWFRGVRYHNGRGLDGSHLTNMLKRFRSASHLNIQNTTMLGHVVPSSQPTEDLLEENRQRALKSFKPDQQLALLISQKSRFLQYLSVAGCHLSEKALVALIGGGMPELTELNLEYNNQFVNCNGFEVFETCPKLETIRLTCCHNMEAAGANKILKATPRLKNLSVQCAGTLFEESNAVSLVESLAASCPLLSMLDVTRNEYVAQGSIDALVQLPRSCNKLATLKLGRFASANLLLELAQHCPDLEHLGISGATLTDESVKKIGAECSHLKELDVSYCEGLTVAALSDGASFAQITALDIKGMPGMTDAVLGVLGSNSPHLEVLAFDSTEAVSHLGILSLASSCVHLKDLEIAHLAITDAAINAFGNFKELTRLALKQSTKLDGDPYTDDGYINEGIESVCIPLSRARLTGYASLSGNSYLWNLAGVEGVQDKISPPGCVVM